MSDKLQFVVVPTESGWGLPSYFRSAAKLVERSLTLLTGNRLIDKLKLIGPRTQ